MSQIRVSRRWLLLLFVSGVPGCGTILYPERRGQPAGLLDWKIVALDAIGLLFFFVPGVIAFAVDFNNGTIYLPPGECVGRSPRPDERRLFTRHVPSGELSISGVQRIVSTHLAQPFELTPGTYTTRPLAKLDEFWPTRDECASEAA